jgi:hypothetical protein
MLSIASPHVESRIVKHPRNRQQESGDRAMALEAVSLKAGAPARRTLFHTP